MENKTKRLNYIDMIKGLSILAIVCYHLNAPCGFKTFVDHIMPPMLMSFFFCSGFFYKPGKRSFGENVRIRAKALLIPFLKYSLIFWGIGSIYMVISKQETVMEAFACLRNFYAGAIWNRVIQNWFGWEYYKLGSRYPFLADFWFLISLFCASVIFFPIADRVLKSKKQTAAAMAGLFALTGILRGFKVDLPHNMQLFPLWAGFLLLGAFAGQQKLFERPELTGARGWICGLVSLAAGQVLCHTRQAESNLFRGTFMGNEVVSMIFCILSSVLVIWGVGMIFRMTEEAGVRVKELSWLGSHSLMIYLYHVFFAWVISMVTGFSIRYKEPLEPGTIAKSVLLTLVCLALCILLQIAQDRVKKSN